MSEPSSPVQVLLAELFAGRITPRDALRDALAHANSNAGKNVYLALDAKRAMSEAEDLPSRFRDGMAPAERRKPLLYGLPISLKDCFDLAGFPTSCGSRFYAEQSGTVNADSAVATRLRAQGAAIVGKTNLHPLAYGITGENPEYGDCAQPRDPSRLTGGSSSGAAASVQEGSAIAAIGTDTGGSIRVPAALCGLAGYRASIELAHERGLWRGGVHLAQSFDTLGWLFRDLRDAPLLAEALFGLRVPPSAETSVRIASVGGDFLRDSEPGVLDGFAEWRNRLCAQGATLAEMDVSWWDAAMEIFAPIQAHEAAAIHTRRTGGDFSHFERSIAERLAWGASIAGTEVSHLRGKHAEFRARMDALLVEHDYLIVPCAPVSRLTVGADHSGARAQILRYTAPVSLAGMPVVALPIGDGVGVQLVAARGADARLLAYAAQIAG
ncbi:MAG TPA: amidase [Candidatus Acidoferrales bacterium]|jgi:aspartyl-tRNA(Asn)/glutamyl-tRNA(Gln) amidotransferase subunit A|nr:amidase [Candidatus Acidoferrales bacterium]